MLDTLCFSLRALDASKALRDTDFDILKAR